MQRDLLKTDAFAIVNDDDGSFIMISEDDLCPKRSTFAAAVVWFLLDASSLGDGDGLAADAWLRNPVLSDTAGRWAYKRLRIARPEDVTDDMRLRSFTDTVRSVMKTLDLFVFTLTPLARSSLFESRSFRVNSIGRALTQFLLVSQKNRVSRRELLTDNALEDFQDDDQDIVLTATFDSVEDVLGWRHMHAFYKFIVRNRWRKIAHVARFLSLLQKRASENNFELVRSSMLPEFIAQQHWKNRVGIGGFLDSAPALVTQEFVDYYRADSRFSGHEGLEGGPFFHEVRNAVQSFQYEKHPDTISQVLQPDFKHQFVKFRLKSMKTKEFMDAPLFDAPLFCKGEKKLSPVGEQVLNATPSLFATWLKKYGRCGGHRGYFREPPDFQHIFSKEFRKFRNYGVARDEDDFVPFHSWSEEDTKRAIHAYMEYQISISVVTITVKCILEHTNIELIDEFLGTWKFKVYAKQEAKRTAVPSGKPKKKLKT